MAQKWDESEEFNCLMQTPLGNLNLVSDGINLKEVHFFETESNITESRQMDSSGILKSTMDQLGEYFHGRRKTFNLPLDPIGTDFQKRVWFELQNLPYGKTASYLELAHKLGNPLLIRAAANANGRNPIAIIIPCHRVIGSNGQLTGYSGGLYRKKFLLDLEAGITHGISTLFQ